MVKYTFLLALTKSGLQKEGKQHIKDEDLSVVSPLQVLCGTRFADRQYVKAFHVVA